MTHSFKRDQVDAAKVAGPGTKRTTRAVARSVTRTAHQQDAVSQGSRRAEDRGTGNAAPQAVQRNHRLMIGSPNDRQEREADRVADLVSRDLHQDVTRSNAGKARPTAPDPKEIAGGGAASAPSSAPATAVGLVSDLGAGQPLDPSTRAQMESSFGQDFSRVRVHTDDRAATSAKALNARAFTLGNDIGFGAEQHAPDTRRHLISAAEHRNRRDQAFAAWRIATCATA